MKDTKKAILATAERMFAEHGFDGVSVRDVTRAAGTNLGAVTYHFGSKKELFGAVMAVKFEHFHVMMDEIRMASLSPELKLRRLMTDFAMEVLHRDPGLKIFFIEALTGAERLTPEAIKTMNERNRLFIDIIADGIGSGLFRKVDLEPLPWIFFGMLSSYILYEPLMPGQRRGAAYSPATVKRVVDTAIDVFMQGISTRRAGRRAGGVTRKRRAGDNG